MKDRLDQEDEPVDRRADPLPLAQDIDENPDYYNLDVDNKKESGEPETFKTEVYQGKSEELEEYLAH